MRSRDDVVTGYVVVERRRPERDRWRASLEWMLRFVAIGLLLWYLAVMLGSRDGRAEHAASDELDSALPRWSTVVAPERVHVALAHPPSGAERDWLNALASAGTAVLWNAPSLTATAIDVEPRADPAGGVDVSVATPAGAAVILRDTIAPLLLDTTDGTLRAYLPRLSGPVDAITGPVAARAALRDSLLLKRLLIIGAAGWETKFAVAALEERGWNVVADIGVAPRSDVRQGTIGAIDTTRYSAVLALDTTAAPYADRIARFVRSGGGLLLWTPATAVRSLAMLAPGAGRGTLLEDAGRQPHDTLPRGELELLPITELANDAVVLERRDGAVAIAARRVGAGRVIETGYTNSWRWRLAGGEDAPERHREWIASLVARVAYAGRAGVPTPPTAVAPLATLVDRLGPPNPPVAAGWRGADPAVLLPWLFGTIAMALLVEWAARRLRGMR